MPSPESLNQTPDFDKFRESENLIDPTDQPKSFTEHLEDLTQSPTSEVNAPVTHAENEQELSTAREVVLQAFRKSEF